MGSFLYTLGRATAARPGRVIALWLAAAVMIITASLLWGTDSEDTFDLPGSDSAMAVELLSAAQTNRAGVTARVVAAPKLADTTFDEPSLATQLAQIEANLRAIEGVKDVAMMQSPDQPVALFTVQYGLLESLSPEDLDRLKDVVAASRDGALQVEAGGELFFNFEETGGGGEELIGIAAAVVILLLAFGSVIAMGLPIGVAIFGLALGISSMPLIAHLIPIPSFAPTMGSMVGLGVGIDYALLLVTRHREFLAQGHDVVEAAARAVSTAGRSVLFAGGTVIISILGLVVAGLSFMTAAAIATSVIVCVMVAASLTLVPALLGLSGHWINRLGIHRKGHAPGTVSQGWQRWGAHVARHAVKYTIGVTVLLLAMTAPLLDLQLGLPDEGTMGESRTERRAYDLVAEGFGAGLNGPLVVAVDLAGSTDVLAPLADAIAADGGVAAVTAPEIDTVADVASIIVFPNTTPQDAATFDTVERLRSDVFPSVLGDSATRAHVGGGVATFGDVSNQVTNRLPWFIAAVILMSFLLLTMVFRSILVPVKAALLNLLSIGAAYGVLVKVFQWGWGKDLIGLETTVPIVSFIPLFMFAVLFGLSMDYEVFLLSRVREEYLATGNNEESVITGLAATARVITSAALIMICVFGGFVLGDDPTIKMMGLGLATAIFVDATIVRVILVPATMKLLGDANWWLPSWLDRRLPHLSID